MEHSDNQRYIALEKLMQLILEKSFSSYRYDS